MSSMRKVRFVSMAERSSHFGIFEYTKKPDSLLKSVLINEWNMKRPKVVFSLIGGKFTLGQSSVQLLTHFRRGLYESAAKVKGWIVTDGYNGGCITEVGRARQLYSTAHNDNVEIIALANFKQLYPKLRQRLLSDRDKEIIISPLHTDKSGKEKVGLSEDEVLESNHSKYLLIEAPDEDGSMKLYKHSMLMAISNLTSESSQEKLPVLGVVFGGDLSRLDEIKSMVLSSHPIILIAHTGGVCDFIRLGIEFLKSMGAIDDTKINSEDEHQRVLIAMESIDDQKTQEFLEEANLKSDNINQTRHLTQVLQLILCQQDLIHVFYHDINVPMENAFFSALANLPSTDERKFQFAIDLKQTDFARDTIIKSTQLTTDHYRQLLEYALINGQPDFVEILINEAINVQQFMTFDTFSRIYYNGLLHEMKHNQQSINRTHLQKAFDISNKQWESQQIQQLGIKDLFPCLAIVEKMIFMDDWESVYLSKDVLKKFITKKQVFTWALIFNRFDIARILWQNSNDCISMALVGTLYFRNIIKQAGGKTACIKTVTSEANFYEEQACEIFKVAYGKNPNKAMKLLIRQSPELGNKTVLELAVESEALEFMALDGVQEKLSRIWHAEVNDDPSRVQSSRLNFGCLLSFSSPKLVYFYNCFFYLLFMALFAYIILFKFCDRPTGT